MTLLAALRSLFEPALKYYATIFVKAATLLVHSPKTIYVACMKTLLNPPPPAEPVIPVAKRGRKLRPITPRQTFALRQWEMDFRFVREIEYLEREGRVSNRLDLERTLGLEAGGVAAIRLGLRGISTVHLAILHETYRGDRDYILHGVRNKELAAPYIAGIGRIDRHEPYYHRYASGARWRVGPRPETHPQYYPQDPENTQWTAPPRKNIQSFS